MFNIYVRPLATIAEDAGLSLFSYAHDTQIVFSLSAERATKSSSLQSGLRNIAGWMQANLLKLNGEKTEVLILGKNKDLWGPQHWPPEMGALPQPNHQVRNLGVLIDDQLSMKQQAVKVSSICFTIIKWLRKILWMLPLSTQLTVVQALVISRLDYGNILYQGANKDVLCKLQMVQNAAARLLCKVPKTVSISGSLRDLHWLRVENRIQFKALSYMLEIKVGKAPQYLIALVHPYLPPRLTFCHSGKIGGA